MCNDDSTVTNFSSAQEVETWWCGGSLWCRTTLSSLSSCPQRGTELQLAIRHKEKPVESLQNKVTMEGNMGLLLISAMRAVTILKR